MILIQLKQREVSFIRTACEYFSENNSIGGIFIRDYPKEKFSNKELIELEEKLK